MVLKGQSRVIIENVQPQVENGLYPAKRTVGESVTVTADIFGDGHDHIRAQVLFKKEGQKKWNVKELIHQGNDVWSTFFNVAEKGVYVFTIHAWIDHLETWYDGFKKKADAKVDVHVELLEGAQLLRKLPSPDKELKEIAATLEKQDNYAEAIALVLSQRFADLVHHHPLITFETKFERELKVVVEHK
ncbi:MAG TPA: maltotransferase domain-containing protein, partial [Chryseosolibacter sp.]|nr:maltotransferase domain-containing protein [Chryseosolibacter sp.]